MDRLFLLLLMSLFVCAHAHASGFKKTFQTDPILFPHIWVAKVKNGSVLPVEHVPIKGYLPVVGIETRRLGHAKSLEFLKASAADNNLLLYSSKSSKETLLHKAKVLSTQEPFKNVNIYCLSCQKVEPGVALKSLVDPTTRTLAIGSGINDFEMLTSAHKGVLLLKASEYEEVLKKLEHFLKPGGKKFDRYWINTVKLTHENKAPALNLNEILHMFLYKRYQDNPTARASMRVASDDLPRQTSKTLSKVFIPSSKRQASRNTYDRYLFEPQTEPKAMKQAVIEKPTPIREEVLQRMGILPAASSSSSSQKKSSSSTTPRSAKVENEKPLEELEDRLMYESGELSSKPKPTKQDLDLSLL